jgi:YidC/Oxa1 family membrane protein insertase
MEKRVLLAIVLSFVILVVWSYFFSPQPPPQTELKQVPVEENKAAIDTKEKVEQEKKEKGVSHSTPGIELPQKDILVDTPLYSMVLTTNGPAIKEFKLKHYHTTVDKKEMVDLAKMVSKSVQHLAWKLTWNQSTKFEVHVDKDSIKLEKESNQTTLNLEYVTQNMDKIVHTFTFYPNSYKIDVASKLILSETNKNVRPRLDLTIYGDEPKSKSYGSHSGFALYMNKSLTEVELSEKKPTFEVNGPVQYLAFESTYFVTSLILNEQSPSYIALKKEKGNLIKGEANLITFGENLPKGEITYALYLGPKDLVHLKVAGSNMDELVNFGWTNFIAKPLLYGMKFCNDYVKNYGVSIIILTIFVKIIFWPLSNKSYKSMKEMQKIQPLLMKIREKYKNDKEQMNRELMQLYRTYKINPMSGCLPIVVQIPVFFALYKVLSVSIELRYAPFIWWIKDLSAPDRLFEFSFSIPLMDPPYGIPILTLLMGASMFIQQKMSPSPGDPTQAKVMLLLPVIFTFMFINFPSGLVLYWFVNNILSIGQQYYIQKKM